MKGSDWTTCVAREFTEVTLTDQATTLLQAPQNCVFLVDRMWSLYQGASIGATLKDP